MAKTSKIIGRIPVSRPADAGTWYKGNIVTVGDVAYQCTADTTTTAPSATSADWQVWSGTPGVSSRLDSIEQQVDDLGHDTETQLTDIKTDIQTQLGDFATDLTNEQSERVSTDALLRGDIDTEAHERQEADSALNTRVKAVEDAIADGVGTVKGITVNGVDQSPNADGIIALTIEGEEAIDSLDAYSAKPVQSSVLAAEINSIKAGTVASMEVDDSGDAPVLKLYNSQGAVIADTEIPAGGGGGGSTETSNLKLYVTASASKAVIKEGESVTLAYGYTSKYREDGEETEAGVAATITIEIKRGASTVFSRTIYNFRSGEAAEVDITEAMAAGSHDIYIKAAATDPLTGTAKSGSAYVSVYVSAISLTSSLSLTTIASTGGITDSSLQVPYTVSGSGVKTLYVYYDGKEESSLTKTNIQPGLRSDAVTLPMSGNVGRHTVQLVAKTTINGTEMLSDSIFFDVFKGSGQAFTLIKMSRSDGKIFASGETPTATAGQYDQCTVNYAAYDPTNERATVEITVDGQTQTVTVPRQQQELTMRFAQQGQGKEVAIKIAGSATANAQRTFAVDVTASSIAATMAGAYALRLSADGRSNSEANPAVWADEVSGDNIATFAGVDWATSGWADSSLKLMNGASLTLDLKPFDRDITSTGLTLEMMMRVTDVADKSAVVVDCVDSSSGTGKGLQISADKIAYLTGASVSYVNEDGDEGVRLIQLSSNYAYDNQASSSEKWMRVAMVVWPSTSDKLMELYIDGSRVAADEYTSASQFVQDSPKKLVFDSTSATIQLRDITLYRRALTDDELIDNAIVGQPTAAQMVSLYEDNTVLGDSGEIDMNKLIQKGKGVIHIIRQGKLDALYAENDKTVDFLATVIYYPSADAKAAGAKAFRVENCNIRIQGTSSTKYPSKNIRIYLNKPDSAVLYIDGAIATNKKYALRSGAQKQSVLCAKSDYSDSSMSLNTGGAKMFNNTMIKMGLLTPPQSYERQAGGGTDTAITRRAAIDGWPVSIFASDTESSAVQYYGQYNLNNEKSKSADIFGMAAFDEFAPTMPLALESLNNQEAACLFSISGDVATSLAEIIPAVKEDEEDSTRFDLGMEVNYCTSRTINGKETTDDVKWDGLNASEKAAVVRLYSFIQACKPAGADTGENNADIDISTWVSDKFASEASQYFDVRYLCAYYLWTDYFLAVDQRAKNILWRTWDGLIWYPTYYDGDTQMGKRNDCFLVYGYTTDRGTWDSQASKRAFEGYRSWLWNLVLANFSSTLSSVASDLRSALSNTEVLRMYTQEQMSAWSDREFNKSGEIKYIYPHFNVCYGVEGSETNPPKKWKFIYALQGANKSHREYMVRNRFAVLDAKYCCGGYKNDLINLYMLSGHTGTFKIYASEAYAFGWSKRNGSMLGSTGIVDSDTEAALTLTGGGANDPLSIYGASRVLSLDAQEASSSFYGMLDLTGCTAMQSLDLSVPTAGEPSRAWFFSVEGCRQLRTVNIKGQTYARTGSESSAEVNLSSAVRLQSVDARDVDIAQVVVAAGAPVTTMRLGAKIETLALDHLPNLAYGASGLSLQSVTALRTIEVLGCPLMADLHTLVLNWINIKEADSSLCTLHLSGMEWTGVTAAQMLSLTAIKNLDLEGTVALSATPTAAEALQLMQAYGDGVFSGTAKLHITAPGGIMIVGPDKITEGEEATVRIIPLADGLTGVTISATASNGAEASVDESAMTVHVSSVVSGASGRSVAVTAYGYLPGSSDRVSASLTVSIQRKVYPDSFTIDCPSKINPGLTYQVSLVPNTTDGVDGVWTTNWSLTGSDKVSLSNKTSTSCTLTVAADAAIGAATLTAQVFKEAAAEPYTSVSADIDVLTADVIMTSSTNPEVMAICYAQGWAANESYMTISEAQSVTKVGVVFKESSIKSFDEFEYFTACETTLDGTFYGCSELQSIRIPEGVTTIGGSTFKSTTSLKTVKFPASFIWIGGGAFGGSGVNTVYAYSNPTSNNFPEVLPQVSSGTIFVSAEFESGSSWDVLSSNGWTISYTL